MPLARRRRRVPGLAPRGGSRIRTGGDAIAAFVLASLSVLICSSVIAALHSSSGANYDALGLVYLPAVIGVAFLFGLRAGVLTSLAAAVVFDAVILPPGGWQTPDARVWLLFAALLLSGAAVAELAARERRRSEQAYEREREAALLAGLSSALVGGASLELAQVDAARVAAAAIGAPAARIVFGRGPLAGQVALPLDVDGRVIGRLELMGADPLVLGDENAQRVARSLAGVLALAQERERLAHADVEAEALRASDALKTALLRAVSHELRTPLTAIKAAVGALRGDQVQLGEEAVRELLADVSIETDRLDRLVSDLLDVSRLQAGSATTALDWCEVDDLLRGAVAAGRSRAPGAHVDVEADDGLPLVHCDASQIERVLVNLIENAAKFSPEGAPVVLRARATDGGDHVEISVIDHGPGIDLDQRERVFEPFYRGRGGGAGGTGLGLAIARGFVQANAGTLTIDDAPGGGTCMRIVLPSLKVTEEVPA
jgi:two-component system sensor histidine kinase KdpD